MYLSIINMTNLEETPDYENNNDNDSDEEWDDITYFNIKPKITTELTMAGEGSHAWSYIIEWENKNDEEPKVYIERYPFKNKELQNDKIIRIRTDRESGYQSIKLFNYNDDIPEDNVRYEYCPFYCPEIK